MTNSNERFWEWVDQQLVRHDLNYYRIERESGLANGTISRPARDWSTPSLTVCKALAQAFGVPPDFVLQQAGLLPRQPHSEDVDPEMRATLEQLHAIWRRLKVHNPEAARRLQRIAILQAEMVEAASRAGIPDEEETATRAISITTSS